MKIKYELAIEASYEKSGDYMSAQSSLDQFLKYYQEQARHFQIMIKEGQALEPKPIKGKISIKSINLVLE